MNRILEREALNPTVTRLKVEAPLIARKAEPGQFVILRTDEDGERIPLTVADFDREEGSVTVIFQVVGATTEKLNHLKPGDMLHDFVGPLGRATHTEGLKKVAVVGGGVGCAIAYPVTKKLHEQGCGLENVQGHIDLDALRRGGANRLSFGVQAAHDNELRRIGRIHDFAKAKNAVLLAHEHGFSNISLDLMYGLPGQTQDMFLDSLAQCLALQPTHLSCYGLKLEPMTEMGREAPVLPDDDAQADTYLALCRVLSQHGFEHYEISNFARPGFRSRHNSKYWDLSEYIGLGPGAHSLFDGRRFAFPRDIAAFTDGTAAVRNEEEVPDFERQNEYLMLRLRTSDGVELRDLEERYHVDPAPYEAVFRALAKPGLTEQNGTRWHLTDAGFLVSNSIINMITDAASR